MILCFPLKLNPIPCVPNASFVDCEHFAIRCHVQNLLLLLSHLL